MACRNRHGANYVVHDVCDGDGDGGSLSQRRCVNGDAQVHPRRPSIMRVHTGGYVDGDGNVIEGWMLYFRA